MFGRENSVDRFMPGVLSLLAAAVLLGGCILTGGDGQHLKPVPLIALDEPAPPQADPEEIAIAEREHPKILAAFGGTYEDSKAELAVARAVGRLVAASEEPWRNYRVTLLDSPAVNAFALPGGYVYVTRGLLALANDTSEVAAVIAHEMAHVTARHAFSRAARLEAAAVASRVVENVVDDPKAVQRTTASSQLSLARFSQNQELQADRVGINTLAKAGYDPFAAARFLSSMARYAAWKAATPGEEDAGADFLSSHPSTPNRIKEAIAAAATYDGLTSERDQEAFLTRVDGLTFGDSARQGFVRGRQFLHANLGFGFSLPEGFSLENTPKAVLASNDAGIAMRFDGAAVKAGGDLLSYVSSGWVNGLIEESVRLRTLNGLPMVTASAAARGYHYRIAVIRFGNETFRFLFATRSPAPAFEEAVEATLASFHPLSLEEKSGLHPLRIKVVTVRQGDTVESLARTMAGVERPAILFRALNGLGPADQPAVGAQVKLVVDR